MFAEPIGVPAKGAATPVAAVEPAGHQLAAYPRSRVRRIPVRVVPAVPVSGLGVSGPVGVDLQLRSAFSHVAVLSVWPPAAASAAARVRRSWGRVACALPHPPT